jgi:hypothetical protein
MNKKLLPWLITFCALGLGGTAAYYSIIGLSKLFAGVATAVIIMTSFLEISKLTLATLLHSYWGQLNKISKIYYIISLIILSLITSAGIYGMLSSGYQKTSDQNSIVDSKIKSLESKKKLFEETRDNILKEKQYIANLQGTLSQASTTQYTDKNGNLIIKSNNAAIRNIESSSKSNEKLSSKIDVINDSIFSVENQILIIKTNETSTSELGPLKYLSGLIGVGMDRIINWLLLIIIFVFDPLAIALVIAANFAFAQISLKKKLTPPQDLWDNTLMDGLEEEEFMELFDKADTNGDGVIDEEEAKQINQVKQSLDEIEKLNNENNYDFQWKKEKVSKEIENIKNSLIKQINDDKDNTKTYF